MILCIVMWMLGLVGIVIWIFCELWIGLVVMLMLVGVFLVWVVMLVMFSFFKLGEDGVVLDIVLFFMLVLVGLGLVG